MEDTAWTLWHTLAVDPAEPRAAWDAHRGAAWVLEGARKLAHQRLNTDLSGRVTRWTQEASAQLKRRNEVVHTVWPYDQLDSVPFRLRTGSQPRNEASIELLPVDIGDVEDLARQLRELASHGNGLAWEMLEIYPDFLEGASWK